MLSITSDWVIWNAAFWYTRLRGSIFTASVISTLPRQFPPPSSEPHPALCVIQLSYTIFQIETLHVFMHLNDSIMLHLYTFMWVHCTVLLSLLQWKWNTFQCRGSLPPAFPPRRRRLETKPAEFCLKIIKSLDPAQHLTLAITVRYLNIRLGEVGQQEILFVYDLVRAFDRFCIISQQILVYFTDI